VPRIRKLLDTNGKLTLEGKKEIVLRRQGLMKVMNVRSRVAKDPKKQIFCPKCDAPLLAHNLKRHMKESCVNRPEKKVPKYPFGQEPTREENFEAFLLKRRKEDRVGVIIRFPVLQG
jgi:hypothetical protein